MSISLAIGAHNVWEHTLTWLLHADKSQAHDAYAGPQEVPTAWNLALVVLLAFTAVAGITAFKILRAISGQLSRMICFPQTHSG